jgi:hypothetical protein
MKHKILSFSLYILVLFLPFQNIFAQYSVNILKLPFWLLLWKEFLVVIISSIFLYDIFLDLKLFFSAANNRKQIFQKLNLYLPIIIYLTSLIFIFFSSSFNQISIRDYILGFRVELFWLGFFVLNISWVRLKFSDLKTILNLRTFRLLFSFSFFGIVIISLASFAVGINNFYSSLGYTDFSSQGTVFLNSPACHVISAQDTKCRLTAGFSSPNHFAAYLLLVLGVFISSLYSKIKIKKYQNIYIEVLTIIFSIVMIVLSFSRYALISVAVVGLVYILLLIYNKLQKYSKIFKGGLLLSVLSPVFLLFFILFSSLSLIQSLNLPDFILKAGSTTDHYKQKNAAWAIITKNPKNFFVGYGLAQSGSVAQPQYNDSVNLPNIILENLDIAEEYDVLFYVMPIPESWYFQLILNGGIFYFILYMLLAIEPLKPLFREIIKLGRQEIEWADIIFGLAFLGIFIGNLFLHIWENQAVSIYFVLIYLYWQLFKSNNILDKKTNS